MVIEMICEERNQTQCDKRGDKITDKTTGFTRIVSMFKNALTGSDEDLSASSPSPVPLYNETNSYRNQLLRLEQLQNRAIENIRRRII